MKKHNIDVMECGTIYIDGERVFGSKPHGLFTTVTFKATDSDLKKISDRCLEVIMPDFICRECGAKYWNVGTRFEKCPECGASRIKSLMASENNDR